MPATAKKKAPPPTVYADQNHNDQPICLDCFLRVRNEDTKSEELEEWGKVQEYTRVLWERIPADTRQQKDLEDPNGWVKLLLDSLKWRRTKGRCWACRRRIALYYRLLVEEIQGAQEVSEFRSRCQAVAAEANSLALAIAASGHRPGVPIFDPDPKYGHLRRLVGEHLASLKGLLAEPDSLSTKVLWRLLNRQLQNVLTGGASQEDLEKVKYEPLELGAQKLWEVAVALAQIGDLGAVAERNFAGVVRAKAKDPYNLPERLALVEAYQEAQKLTPPMGYGELAKALIDHEVVDEKWCCDTVDDLKANIQRAVKKYRDQMPLRAFPYQGQGGTTPR